MVVCVLVPQLIFMRRSKVSLIFDGVSGETFHDSPDAGKYNWNTARHTNVLVPFMSRSKVSLIFDGVSGETFHDSPDAGKYNWNTARHTNLF